MHYNWELAPVHRGLDNVKDVEESGGPPPLKLQSVLEAARAAGRWVGLHNQLLLVDKGKPRYHSVP